MSKILEFVGLNKKVSAWFSKKFPKVFASPNPSYKVAMKTLIAAYIKESQPNKILEAGGINRPFLEKSSAYEYIGLDIEFAEGCEHLYDKFFAQSIEQKLPEKVNVIISYTLLEHVPDNSLAVSSMYDGLTKGGAIFHYIPSGLHPYSIILRIIGPQMQKYLIPLLRPGAEAVSGYPAFFNFCTPSSMRKLLEQNGFSEVNVKPFYRANDYFAFFIPLYLIISVFENICRNLNLEIFASGFIVTARKPN